MNKQCFKCGEVKSVDEFYVHRQMSDGRLGKCKDCTKADNKARRDANLEAVREYDRRRGSRQSVEYQRKYSERFSKKRSAQHKVNNAIRVGKLVKAPCEVCGNVISVGHHDDYSKPLDVRWLCHAHHSQWHAANGPGINGEDSTAEMTA